MESLRSMNWVASLRQLSRFAPYFGICIESIQLFHRKFRNMERSDSTNGAKRLHIWSEATLFGGVRGGGSPPDKCRHLNYQVKSILFETIVGLSQRSKNWAKETKSCILYTLSLSIYIYIYRAYIYIYIYIYMYHIYDTIFICVYYINRIYS